MNRGPSKHINCLGIDVFALPPKKVQGKVLYFFPPKCVLSSVLAMIANNYKDNQILLVFHVLQEMPVGWSRITETFKQIKMMVYRKGPLSIVPDERQLMFRQKVMT